MVPLHMLKKSKALCDRLLLNGTLSIGREKYYVQGLPFEILSISGYNDLDCHSVSKMWIQTDRAKINNVWYRLNNPSLEYARYYNPFLWIATFGKHFVDYLIYHPIIELRDFKIDFHDWIFQHHGTSIQFQQWLRQYKSTDFRVAVAAHHEFLWKEATDIDKTLRRRHIWKEVYYGMLNAITKQPNYIPSGSGTIVTPFVFDCFRDMYFARVLEPRECTNQSILDMQRSRKQALGFFTKPYLNQLPTIAVQHRPPKSVQQGQVVSIPRDSKTKWVDKADTWLGTWI